MSIFLNSALLSFNSKSVDALAKVVFGTNPYLRFKNYDDSFYDYDGYSIWSLLFEALDRKDPSMYASM